MTDIAPRIDATPDAGTSPGRFARSTFTRVVIGVGMALTLAAPAGRAIGGPIEDLRPGEWYEVPNSHLRDVVPNPERPGYTGAGSIMGAWSGGAYDTRRDRLVVWGGGHNDYGGNELYAFDLSTLAWQRVWGPSSSIPDPPSPTNEAYSDGNPASRHTYDGLEYIPTVDRFFAWGGSLYSGSGAGGHWTWTFDFDAGRWQHVSDPTINYADLEHVTACDPTTGKVYLGDPSDGLREYDPAADRWTSIKSGTIAYGQTGEFDPKRKKFLAVGSGQTIQFDLAPGGASTPRTLSTTGARNMETVDYPGVAYDPVSDLIVAWNGGSDVYTLNMDTLVWTKRTLAPTNTVTPTAASTTGTYGRWRYVPSKNVFIGVNHINQNVYIYKLSSGGGAPADSIPPSGPANLIAR